MRGPRDFVTEFVQRYRDKAADPFLGASAEAQVMTRLLDQLEREHEAFLDEELNSVAAAAESGYSKQQIALLRRQRVITKRRGDLPRKPGYGVVLPKAVEHDQAQDLTDAVIAARRRGALRVG